MIGKHWEGIVGYCRPENLVPLEFVEGIYNNIKVIERRAYCLRYEEYLLPHVLRCALEMIRTLLEDCIKLYADATYT